MTTKHLERIDALKGMLEKGRELQIAASNLFEYCDAYTTLRWIEYLNDRIKQEIDKTKRLHDESQEES